MRYMQMCEYITVCVICKRANICILERFRHLISRGEKRELLCFSVSALRNIIITKITKLKINKTYATGFVFGNMPGNFTKCKQLG
jgi:hypothetical protein